MNLLETDNKSDRSSAPASSGDRTLREEARELALKAAAKSRAWGLDGPDGIGGDLYDAGYTAGEREAYRTVVEELRELPEPDEKLSPNYYLVKYIERLIERVDREGK